MSVLPEGVHEGRADDTSQAIFRFCTRNQPEPLSPLWEAWINSYWLPNCWHHLQERRDSNQVDDPDAHPNSLIPILKRGAMMHAFNFSDAGVSVVRAMQFLKALGVIRNECSAKVKAQRAWWPQGPAVMIHAVRKEREEIDRPGHRVREGGAKKKTKKAKSPSDEGLDKDQMALEMMTI